MPQENVEIVRDANAAFNRGDLDAFLEYCTDDVDFRAAEAPQEAPCDAQRFSRRWLGVIGFGRVQVLLGPRPALRDRNAIRSGRSRSIALPPA